MPLTVQDVATTGLGDALPRDRRWPDVGNVRSEQQLQERTRTYIAYLPHTSYPYPGIPCLPTPTPRHRWRISLPTYPYPVTCDVLYRPRTSRHSRHGGVGTVR